MGICPCSYLMLLTYSQEGMQLLDAGTCKSRGTCVDAMDPLHGSFPI